MADAPGLEHDKQELSCIDEQLGARCLCIRIDDDAIEFSQALHVLR